MMDESDTLETDIVEAGRRRSAASYSRQKRLQNQWTLPDTASGIDDKAIDPSTRRRTKKSQLESTKIPSGTSGAWECGDGDVKSRRRRKKKGEKSVENEPFSSVARCKNMDIKITLADEGIVWSTVETVSGRKPEQYTLPYERIISAELGVSDGMFIVKYVDIVGGLKKMKSMELFVGESVTAKRWVKYTSKIINSLFKRPKKLRVFLHINAGRGNAAATFKTHGLPKLRDVSIDTDIVEMKNAEDFITDVDEIEDLNSYDGFLVVGNQLSFRFLLNAVMQRVHADQDIHLKPGVSPLPCPIPLGLLPIGRRCDLVTTMSMTSDFSTALMNVLMGMLTSTDILTIYKKSQCLGYAFNCQYGFGANALSLLPENRPASDKRAEALLSKTLAKDRLLTYDCDVHYIPSKLEDVSYPTDDKFCYAGCDICTAEANRRRKNSITCDQVMEINPLGESHHSGSVIELKEDSNWRSLKGSFLWIGIYSIPCRNELMSPHGLSPCAHISDGSADLVLVRDCKRKEFLRFLKRHGSSAKNPLELPFVETHRVSNVRFQPRQNITWEHRDVKKTEIDYQMKNNNDGCASVSASSGDLSDSEIRFPKKKMNKDEVEVIIDDCTDDEEDFKSPPLKFSQSMNTLDLSFSSSSDDENSNCGSPSSKSRLESSHSTPKRDKAELEDDDGKKKKKGLRRLSLFSFKTTEASDVENKTYIRPRVTPAERERERRKAKELDKEEKRRRKAEERLKSSWIFDYEQCVDTDLEFAVHSHVVSVFGCKPSEDAKMEDCRLSWLPLF